MQLSRTLSAAALVALLLSSASSWADLPVRRASQVLPQLPDQGERFLHAVTGAGSPQILVRVRDRNAALAQGLIPITETLAAGRGNADRWAKLDGADGIREVLLAPVRAPLLDQAAQTLGSQAAREETGLTGEGVIVGVVDTGADAAHDALRRTTGESRIAWILAFGEPPRGLHPEMEKEYGCDDEDNPCAILSGDDLDEIIDSRILASLPKDQIGHGTHIASLAAGRDDSYPGVAPGSDLVIVAASEATGSVSDARILLGTRFVFDRAEESQKPAVVNISLGSSLGAHDGSSEVERGLAELAAGPGRAVVIASGNSGYVFEDLFPEYPGAKGIHTEVAVLPSSEVRVPVITPPLSTKDELTGSFFVWIASQPGDEISVGFANGDDGQTALIAPGQSGGIHSSEFGDADKYDIVIFNGVDDELGTDIPKGNTFVGVAGTWKAGRVFDLVLRGEGHAKLWISGREDLSPALSVTGPLFPRALPSGTVAVPGSHPDIITVGATVNRVAWVDHEGGLVSYANETGVQSFFSASGPNLTGAMKPELVAPGGGVIGAMAREADPRTSQFSQFAALGSCAGGIECFIIDDEHGVASGTSMSAPLVSGAVALMMQRDPELTMEDAKRHLMAGSTQVPKQALGSLVGAGELNLVGALRAQEAELANSNSPVDANKCRLVWSRDFVYPATGPSVEGFILLRDADDVATTVRAEDIEVEVRGPGRAIVEPLSAGLSKVILSGDPGSASEQLVVITKVNGEAISKDTFPIERDAALAEHGFELAGGSCSWGTPEPAAPLSFWGLFGALSWMTLRRRRAQH